MQASKSGVSRRFHIRQAQVGYAGVASPIQVKGDHIGVIVLLNPALEQAERVLEMQREIGDPLGEITAALDVVLEQTGGRRAARYRYVVEAARHAAARATEWSEQLRRLVTEQEEPGTAARGAFDPSTVVRSVVQATAAEAAKREIRLELHSNNALPPVRGDRLQFEPVLIRTVRERLAQTPRPRTVVLSARAVGRDGEQHIVMALTERSELGGYAQAPPTPTLLGEVVSAMGGVMGVMPDATLGITLLMRFAAAE